jgi:5-methylcytosine-specific restriction endonuclease McrA
MKILTCNHHGVTQFNWDGKQHRCGKCASERFKKMRAERKRLLVDEAGGKCQICGYDKCLDALEFHHRDPSQKDFSIARQIRSLDVMRKETAKCMLLCANCHREQHSTVA